MTSRPPFRSHIQYTHLYTHSTRLQFSHVIVCSTPWAPFPTMAHWIMWQSLLSFCITTSLAPSHRKGRWLLKDPPASGRGRSEWHIPHGQPLLLAVGSHLPVPQTSPHTPPLPPSRLPSMLWYFTGATLEEAELFTLLATHAFVSGRREPGGREGEREKMREESNDP